MRSRVRSQARGTGVQWNRGPVREGARAWLRTGPLFHHGRGTHTGVYEILELHQDVHGVQEAFFWVQHSGASGTGWFCRSKTKFSTPQGHQNDVQEQTKTFKPSPGHVIPSNPFMLPVCVGGRCSGSLNLVTASDEMNKHQLRGESKIETKWKPVA